MSVIKSVLAGSMSVITDIVSANVLAQVLLLTTQQDLIIALAVESIVLVQFVDEILSRFFAKSDILSENAERVILRCVAVLRIALLFVLVRISMGVVTEIFETSQMRWHELVVIIVLTFGFIFTIVERNTETATSASAAAAATTTTTPPKKTS